MQSNIVGRSPIKDYQDVHNRGSTLKPGWSSDDRQPFYKIHKPRRDFSCFDGEDVHKWLYKCN